MKVNICTDILSDAVFSHLLPCLGVPSVEHQIQQVFGLDWVRLSICDNCWNLLPLALLLLHMYWADLTSIGNTAHNRHIVFVLSSSATHETLNNVWSSRTSEAFLQEVTHRVCKLRWSSLSCQYEHRFHWYEITIQTYRVKRVHAGDIISQRIRQQIRE
jgi:hypothetical protein